MRVLFVGINPGIRSALTGHHFAGPSNRFWRLLYDSRLVPEPLTPDRDDELPRWGFGMTNLVARPTAGIGDLRAGEYQAGRAALLRKVRRSKPAVLALVGVTLYRALFGGKAVSPGVQDREWGGARVFVLPNPSGRNANYSYAEMLDAFAALRQLLQGSTRGPVPPRSAAGGGSRHARRPSRRPTPGD